MIARRSLLAAAAAAASGIAASRAWSQAGDTALVPFRYRASDAALSDLKRRLEQTRWPEHETGSGWDQGPPLAALQRLVEHWRTDYDWRQTESRLAGWPQFKTTINGLGFHIIHVRSRHPNAMPIVLTHGWPDTVLLFADVVAPLTDASHRHDATWGAAYRTVGHIEA